MDAAATALGMSAGPPHENPVAAEFVRQRRDRQLSPGDYGAQQRRSGTLVDVSA